MLFDTPIGLFCFVFKILKIIWNNLLLKNVFKISKQKYEIKSLVGISSITKCIYLSGVAASYSLKN